MEQEEPSSIDPAPLPGDTAGPSAALNASPIRVLAADSRPLLLGALAELIERQRPHMELVAQAASYARALYLAERHRPDVVLLSLFEDRLDALETVSALNRLRGGKVLVLKSKHDSLPASRLLRLGAAGVVIAEEPPDAIIKAVRQVHLQQDPGKRQWISRLLPLAAHASGPGNEGRADGMATLTIRERALIKVMVANPGAKYPAICAQLGITEHTVHNYLTSIYQKLSLTNRTDLLVYAVRHGLAGGDDEDDTLGGRLVN